MTLSRDPLIHLTSYSSLSTHTHRGRDQESREPGEPGEREGAGEAQLVLALRRVLLACWTCPEHFRAQVAELAALVAQRPPSALEEAAP